MLFWVLGFFILLIVALVPILSIVLDSPAMRRIIDARADAAKLEALSNRVQTLESEVSLLERGVEGLKEENKFLQKLLEKPKE